MEEVTDKLDNGKPGDIIYLDSLSKAFQKVKITWHWWGDFSMDRILAHG